MGAYKYLFLSILYEMFVRIVLLDLLSSPGITGAVAPLPVSTRKKLVVVGIQV